MNKSISVKLIQPVTIRRDKEYNSGFVEKLKKFLNCSDINKMKRINTVYSSIQINLMSYILGKVIKKHYSIHERESGSDNENRIISVIKNYDGINHDENYGLWEDLLFLDSKENIRIVLLICLKEGLFEQNYMDIILREEDLSYYKTFKKQIEEEIGLIQGQMFGGDGEMLSLKRKYNWNDVILSEETDTAIKQNIVEFFENKDIYYSHNVFKRGMILHGEPGNGKTLICKVLASQLAYNYIWITTKDISTRGAEKISLVYELARIIKPVIVFLEDIDLVASDRSNHFLSEVLGELLQQLDGMVNENNGIITIATTNNINAIDKAIGRAGRFDIKLKIGKPSYDMRVKILQKETETLALGKDVCLDEIAELSEGFSGAMLNEIIIKATISAIRYKLEQNKNEVIIEMKHLFEALNMTREMRKGVIGFTNGEEAEKATAAV